MWAVMKLIREGQVGALPCRLDSDGLAGMIPVFKLKKDAVKESQKGKYQIIEISAIEPGE